MDGEQLKVHCRNDNDFRKIQSYLDNHAITYTTLFPNKKEPHKISIRAIPPYTDPQLKINAVKEHNFVANRAAMLKSRKTGKLMPIYLVNLFPKVNFEEIYEIKKLCYLKVIIKSFKGS